MIEEFQRQVHIPFGNRLFGKQTELTPAAKMASKHLMVNGMLAYETSWSGYEMPVGIAGDLSAILDSQTQSLAFRLASATEFSEDAIVFSYLL